MHFISSSIDQAALLNFRLPLQKILLKFNLLKTSYVRGLEQ